MPRITNNFEGIQIDIISFDRVAQIYDDTRWVPNSIIEKMWNYINENCSLTEKSRILDLGIGTGRLSLPLIRKQKISIIGLDISEEMLKKARENLNSYTKLPGTASFIHGDARYLPFRSQSFDLIICVHILHLIKDWKAVIVEGDRCLIPGKKQLVQGSVHVSWYKTVPFQIYWESLTSQGYARKRSRWTWYQEGEDFLKQLGYSIQKFSYQEKIEVSPVKAFSMLEERVFSSQWRVPEEQHLQAINKVWGWMQDHKNVDIIDTSLELEIQLFKNLTEFSD
ncbi:MAG: class I SAM-dependent methyltransferase [Promethearchaeota archaeon]